MRFIVRPDGSGLVLGKVMFTDGTMFRVNHVYELRHFQGDPIIIDLGESSMEEPGLFPNWNTDVNNILSTGRHLITKKEFEENP